MRSFGFAALSDFSRLHSPVGTIHSRRAARATGPAVDSATAGSVTAMVKFEGEVPAPR